MSYYLSSNMLILIVQNIIIFRRAVLLTKDKEHLTDKGKLEIIGYKKEMQGMTDKWIPSTINNKINITKHWLLIPLRGMRVYWYKFIGLNMTKR